MEDETDPYTNLGTVGTVECLHGDHLGCSVIEMPVGFSAPKYVFCRAGGLLSLASVLLIPAVPQSLSKDP